MRRTARTVGRGGGGGGVQFPEGVRWDSAAVFHSYLLYRKQNVIDMKRDSNVSV